MVQQKNVKFPLIWFNAVRHCLLCKVVKRVFDVFLVQRQARIEKQSNKAWLAYNAAVKQLRRLKDEVGELNFT